MKFRIKKTWVGVLGVALALSTAGGIAIATAAEQEGAAAGVATVPDPYKSAVPLKLYNAAGTEITTGTTTTQIAGFAAADGDVRAGDDHASLFVHRPQSSNAPGDWPGVQVSGTDSRSPMPSIPIVLTRPP